MHFTLTTGRYKKGILLLIFLFIHTIIFAQNPTQPAVTATPQSSQATNFYQRAKQAGMSDLDVEKAALQRGYTTDQISSMRRSLQAGQNANLNEKKDPGRDELDETRQEDLDDEANNERDSTKISSRLGRNQSRNFGSSFFLNSTSTFEPNLRVATPKNYILGPEDELVVDIFGNSVNNFRMKISPEGTVKMLNLAPVYINGLTIDQAKERITARLRQAYSGLNSPGSGTYSTITLGNVRSIRVMITGEANRPGTYTISSLATAFNALYQSGGPNQNGSYRNIEVIRNNAVIRTIDLYRFLIDADLKDDISLQDQDVILIRPFETRVEIAGQVKRPGIFELKKDETAQQLIRYAGGFTPEAYTAFLNYQRNNGINFVIGTLELQETNTFVPQNGDLYTVKKILEVVANQVEIYGAVTRPGIYALEERCNTVLKLIQMSQGTSARAFFNRAVLERSSGETQTGIISFDLRKLLTGEIADIPLLPGDILTIKSVEDLKEFTYLSIDGSVINPGYYNYFKDITVADLIFQAGGYTEGGIPYRIEISRRVKNDTIGLPSSQNVRIFTIDLADNLQMNVDDQKFKLLPHDVINIRKSPRYESQKSVTVLGEVVYPGNYTILTNFERISDLLPKAGGIKLEAYLEGARFYRNQELVAVDINAIIREPSRPSNLLLQSGDSLTIPRKPETVRIVGGVQNPSIMNFDSELKFNDYISQAGGYGENAWKSKVYVSYPNGRTYRTNRVLFFKSHPKVEPGSTITVPIKAPKPDRQISAGERIAIISLLTTLAITLIRTF